MGFNKLAPDSNAKYLNTRQYLCFSPVPLTATTILFSTIENKYCHIFWILVLTWYWSIGSCEYHTAIKNKVKHPEPRSTQFILSFSSFIFHYPYIFHSTSHLVWHQEWAKCSYNAWRHFILQALTDCPSRSSKVSLHPFLNVNTPIRAVHDAWLMNPK